MLQLHPGTVVTELPGKRVQIANPRTSLTLKGLSNQEITLLKQLTQLRSRPTTIQLALSLGISESDTELFLRLLADHELISEYAVDLESSHLDFDPTLTEHRLRSVSNLSIDLTEFPYVFVADYVKILADLLLGKGFASVTIKATADLIPCLPANLQMLVNPENCPDADLVIKPALSLSEFIHFDRFSRNGIPVLAVLFTPDYAQVGPLVKPLDSPCFKCFNLYDAENPQPTNGESEGPLLKRTLLVGAAAMTAEAVVSIYTEYPWIQGEMRLLDRDMIFERLLWLPHPKCTNHPLTFPEI
ncbi:hypothetical protein HMPREF0044_0679 [Gleimia coleocanis DSM 15436]|uniref:Uncharacterized protein n=1 Tax=Gleimia coleocanis DSM 15436 TaxID=525245 RepID=C0W0T6_9ACTO|nr:hypothetical protein [Gleimia coleocanis]EEH63660.1 hypothetical protein HMPREF0044_0679 [Gleimia coleocanis DSM 15436]